MLPCITRSKQPDESTGNNKHSVKTLTSQIKDMAVNCNPCSRSVSPQHHQQKQLQSELLSDRFRWSYRRNGSKGSRSGSGRVWGKEMEARLKGMSAGRGDVSVSSSGRRTEPVVVEEEKEPKEWVAQVEPGVLITFVSLPRGGNHLKRIRFSRETFNKWQAQKWWQENYDKLTELYNVQRLNRHAFPAPTPPRSEDESNSKFEYIEDSPITPALSQERLPSHPTVVRSNQDVSGIIITPKVSSINGAKTEASSMDASRRTSSSREAEQSGELSMSYVSDVENEWVEQVEPGVYITIRALPGGSRELKRVRFSKEKFGEVHARLWWEENRARIHKQFL